MALTKVQKTGITDNAIDADKIEDGTIVAADIAPGTITNAKLAGSIANDKLANSSITVNGSSVSLGGSVTAGKVEWQAVKTADFNAVAGEGYFVDTDSVGAVTATLPGSPSAGDTIAFKDYAGTFGTNSLTIARNGNNIQGVANDSEISTNRASVVLVYIDATKGWLYTNESNVADLEKAEYITATGGTITTSGDYKIHSFTGDGCFVVSSLGNQCGSASTVDYLVVAGGGSGGVLGGGGGGGGGFRESKDSTLSSPHTASPLAATTGLTVTATTYPVTVGAGGASSGTSPSCNGNAGSNSIFSTITSAGGGYGGGNSPGPTGNGGSGGSGGGGNGGNGAHAGGSGNTPPVSPSQGSNGGSTTGCNVPNRGSGGGGATVVGGNGGNQGPGGGGAGATTHITGSPVGYAGGGGGGAGGIPSNNCNGSGSPCGSGGFGGNGGSPAPTASMQGATNRGGGGGGGELNEASGAGGKGIVIIRYKFQ